MAPFTPLLTMRAVVLAGMEATYGTIPALDPTLDAILVSAPTFAPSFKTLTRNYIRPSLSPFPLQMGQKLATLKFSTELANAGALGTPARLGRLLRACGFTETINGAATFSSVQGQVNSAINGPPVSWTAAGGALSNLDPITYVMRCTHGGGPGGTVRFTITPNDASLDGIQTNVTATSGTAIVVGTKGLSVTPVWTGSLVVDQVWFITIYPPGILYTPRSTGFESIGMQFYVDGSMHSLSGAFGTVSLTGNAGDFANLSFTFTGSYVANIDAAFPNPVFDATNEPPLLQNACLSLADFEPVISSFTYDVKNKITTRTSANAPNGYLGVRITSRQPTGGIDPEATLVANHDFWNDLSQAISFPMSARWGSLSGNKVAFLAPQAQYTGLTYKDNAGIRAYNGALQFASLSGEDESSLFFY